MAQLLTFSFINIVVLVLLTIILIVLIIVFYSRKKKNLDEDIVKILLDKKIDDHENQRKEIISKLAKEGKTVPINTLVKHLDAILVANPGNAEIIKEVNARKHELLTKYKNGIPAEIAYQWLKG